MNTYFTVGELAKLCNISKQTLIFYDKEGVFKPTFIDPSNHYRYYNANQIEVLDSILILKEIGLSLQEIKDFMEIRTSQNAVSLLKKQQLDMELNIKNLKLISKRLSKKIALLEDFYTHPSDEITLKILDVHWLATEAVSAPYGLLEVDLALKSLLTKACKDDYPHFYQIGDMVSSKNRNKGNYTLFSYAFLPLAAPCKKATLHQKPAGLYASFYHRGEYQSIEKSYEKLMAGLQKRNLSPTGFSYEFCILDSLTTRNDSEYITEIQIQVEQNLQK